MSAYARFEELQSEVRDYFDAQFDAKKVLPKIGGKRPGKKCKGSYIAADKKCKGHYSAEGKLTEAGKASAQELAGKVRARKNLKPLSGDNKEKSSSKGKKMEWASAKPEDVVKNIKSRSIELPELQGSDKQVEWASRIRGEYLNQFDNFVADANAQMDRLKAKGRYNDGVAQGHYDDIRKFVAAIGSESSASNYINTRGDVAPYPDGSRVSQNSLTGMYVRHFIGSGRKPKIWHEVLSPDLLA